MTSQGDSALRLSPDQSTLELSDAFRLEARAAIVQRLGELVTWPTSRIPPYERQLAADILIGLLRNSSSDLRGRVAHGLASIHDAPKALLRYLARDDIQIAQTLIETGVGFDDSDLIATVRAGVSQHWLAVTRRKTIAEPVADALMQTNDALVIEALLRNAGARLSAQSVDMAVARSRTAANLLGPLIARAELRPTQALVLFWWCNSQERMAVLRRFACDRSVLIEQLGEMFRLAAQEGWGDAEARKALQLIERRQRNRSAADKSPYGSLEGAAERAELAGIDTNLMQEIAHLAGIKPHTAAQIFNDPGGEALAVLAKATGLRRGGLFQLWKGMKRPLGEADQAETPFGRMMAVFETLSTAKAQTVLRYWNWSFTAEPMGGLAQDVEEDDNFTPARRNATLLLRRNA